jgi:hypothetical protein
VRIRWTMKNASHMDQPAIYEIIVQGRLVESWSSWFDGMQITPQSNEEGDAITTLTGPLIDQAALHGLLTRIRDLGLMLLSIQRKSDDK